MVGKITYQSQDKKHEVVLENDGTIHGASPALREILESLLRQHALDYSPADGPAGWKALEEFAHAIGGKLSPDESSKSDEEKIY